LIDPGRKRLGDAPRLAIAREIFCVALTVSRKEALITFEVFKFAGSCAP
jgi:hypothetical protein